MRILRRDSPDRPRAIGSSDTDAGDSVELAQSLTQASEMLGYCFFLSRAGTFAWAASLCPGFELAEFLEDVRLDGLVLRGLIRRCHNRRTKSSER